ncbi:MAG: hypothetical protein HY216_15035 [Candidatus Rokubacteria bacterium]|nr:hypothetical protein [Candidatus Rokubacteria bacterium]
MTGRLLVAVLLVAAPAVGAALDVKIDRYRQASAAGAMGTIAGRAYEEPRKKTEGDRPLGDVAVTMLPRSDDFLARMSAIKERMREDAAFYRQSAVAVITARREFERALSAAGAGDLVRFGLVTPDGNFDVSVPAGPWIVMAHRAVFVAKASPPPKLRYRGHDVFAQDPRLLGYYTIAVWLFELTVEPGKAAVIDLHDRNVWVTAIEERRDLGADPWSAPKP